jgi:hypothetical protein
MDQEEFLIRAAKERLSKPKFKTLTEGQKDNAIKFCLTSWRQSDHRAEDALRKMESMAKKL